MKNLINSLALLFISTSAIAAEIPPRGTIPEPGTYALLAIGAVALFVANRRKK
jgi:hypothetical protein